MITLHLQVPASGPLSRHNTPGIVFTEAEQVLRQIEDTQFSDKNKLPIVGALRDFLGEKALLKVVGRGTIEITDPAGTLPLRETLPEGYNLKPVWPAPIV